MFRFDLESNLVDINYLIKNINHPDNVIRKCCDHIVVCISINSNVFPPKKIFVERLRLILLKNSDLTCSIRDDR
jgi:hypothetical protein